MTHAAFFLRVSAVLGGLAVILGAFGAHALKARLAPEQLTIFEVGVRYHMYHALALLAVSAAGGRLWNHALTSASCWAWLAGIVVFSGSLYLLAMTGAKWLGAITPLGGVAFIVGWALLFVAAFRA